MTNERVRRVQELRRSSAATPRPGRRREEPGDYSPVCTHPEHPWWRCPVLDELEARCSG